MAGGPRSRASRVSNVVFYGSQSGQVTLSDRKLQVERPRVRQKGPGKSAPLPVGDSGDGRDGWRVEVIREPAMIEVSEAEVETLQKRRFDEIKLLVIYIDGVIFGEHTMVGAVGVDKDGKKHVLDIRSAAEAAVRD